MAEPREILIDWLRDAHAMEKSTIDNLERNIERLEGYPDMREKFRQHLSTTRRQADRLEGCLQRLGADTSIVKDAVTRLAGILQPTVTGAAPDEVVKHAVAALAWEQFQIANYTALAGAAEQVGDTAMKAEFEQAVQEEEDLAGWLSDNIPNITRQYITRSASDGMSARH